LLTQHICNLNPNPKPYPNPNANPNPIFLRKLDYFVTYLEYYSRIALTS